MSDGVAITAGSGTTVATDDTGASGHVQLFKLAIATDGSATLVPATAADGLLVNLGTNNDVTVTNGGTFVVQVDGTALTSLQSIETAVEGTLTVGSHAVTDGGSSLTVDAPVGTPVFVRLSDGSSAITTLPVSIAGTVAVTQSGTWDEVGINDSGNSITVDDGGTSLTVDGTVSVSGQPVNIQNHISDSGTLVATTVETATLTVSGFTAVELEISNVDGAAAIYWTLDNTSPSTTNFAGVLPATPSNTVVACSGTPTLKLYSAGTPVWAAAVRGD
jgi:hypothetical protein